MKNENLTDWKLGSPRPMPAGGKKSIRKEIQLIGRKEIWLAYLWSMTEEETNLPVY